MIVLTLIVFFLTGCKKDGYYNSTSNPTLQTGNNDKHLKLPESSKLWLDSLEIYNFIDKNILVVSNNGLSESILLSCSHTDNNIAYLNGTEYSIERHWYIYKSSLYGNNFEMHKQFRNYELIDTSFNAWDPAIEIVAGNYYYQLLADSSSDNYYGSAYPFGTYQKRQGWVKEGKQKIGNKFYSEVYRIDNLLPGKFLQLRIDKHFGIIEYITADSVKWNIQYE